MDPDPVNIKPDPKPIAVCMYKVNYFLQYPTYVFLQHNHVS